VGELVSLDERAAALHQLAGDEAPGFRYRPGKYLFTDHRIFGIPYVDVVLAPEPELSTRETTSPVPLFRHRFHAFHIDGEWWGYFHDEELGRAYQAHRANQAWMNRWVGYLLGGPLP
jgi:hypothetical protein